MIIAIPDPIMELSLTDSFPSPVPYFSGPLVFLVDT